MTSASPPPAPSAADRLRAFAAAHDVAIYTAEWCPDCRRLKDLLKRENVRHRWVDIESDPAGADRLVRETGKRAIPYVLVDDRTWVRGYHMEAPSRLDVGLLAKELGA
jgi:thioredoxin reductase (NADPH)